MATLVQYVAPTSAQLADALLRAWVCGNEPLFKRVLAHSTNTWSAEDSSNESERLELLNTVGSRMKLSPVWSRTATADPGIEWCVDMLEHLAFTQIADVAPDQPE